LAGCMVRPILPLKPAAGGATQFAACRWRRKR